MHVLVFIHRIMFPKLALTLLKVRMNSRQLLIVMIVDVVMIVGMIVMIVVMIVGMIVMIVVMIVNVVMLLML